MKPLTKIILCLIIVLAFGLRVYHLNIVPPSLDWDETDVGYNALSIASYGHDEWGKSWPLTFESFGDYKSPVHVYLTALSVKFLGLSDFSVRLPSAIFGLLGVIALFFLAKELFKNENLALIASGVLAISPYNLQFSRFNHEAVFALFFFMVGFYLFLKGLRLKNWLLSISFGFFGLTLITYHSPKILVPLFLVCLFIFYFKQLWKVKKLVIGGVILLALIGSLFLIDPNLTGFARASQASIPDTAYQATMTFQRTHNLFLAKIEFDIERYLSYFSYNYLFEHGDKISRHSIQLVGEFYKVELPFLLIGLVLLIKSRKRESWLLLIWALLAPVPGTITGGLTEAPHAARGLFMMGSWHLIIAYGLWAVINWFKPRMQMMKVLFIVGLLAIYVLSLGIYLKDYYQNYPKQQANDWQYGMAVAAKYVADHPHQYQQIFMTDERSQPYVFFLYQLKVPLPDYLENVVYNQASSKSHNLVSSFWFDRVQYNFGNWNPIESLPQPGVLYIVTPSQYDGLMYKAQFTVKDHIKYPDGGDDLFLISQS